MTPWYPLEGAGKLAFVVGCWWGGGWLVYGGVTRHLYYWQVALLAGLGLLALGTGLAINPIRRWRKDRVELGGFWGTGPTVPASPAVRGVLVLGVLVELGLLVLFVLFVWGSLIPGLAGLR